jgi:basic membrane lipoprotein Med (substrate-binding protein (PBP1-ABC) superfamily)
MSSKRVHIIKRNDGWAVKKEGTERASRIYDNKSTAKEAAKSYQDKGHDVIIHRKDGTIEGWKKAR